VLLQPYFSSLHLQGLLFSYPCMPCSVWFHVDAAVHGPDTFTVVEVIASCTYGMPVPLSAAREFVYLQHSSLGCCTATLYVVLELPHLC